MAQYEFKLGTGAGTMTLLSELNIYAPAWEYSPHSVAQLGGDGLVKGGGWAVATWYWTFIKEAMYLTLREYCAGKSAVVYIRTQKTSSTWDDFQAKVEWPDIEQWHNGRVLDFELKFTDLEEI